MLLYSVELYDVMYSTPARPVLEEDFLIFCEADEIEQWKFNGKSLPTNVDTGGERNSRAKITSATK